MDNDGTFNNADDDDNDGMTDTYEISYGVANKHADGSGKVYSGWQNPYVYNARYAILIGGWSNDPNKNWDAIKNDLYSMYNVLVKKYNYEHENIYYHSMARKKGWYGDSYVDGPSDWDIIDANNRKEWGDGVFQSFDKIRKKITKNDFLYLMTVAHGYRDELTNKGQGGFGVYDVESGGEGAIWYGNFANKLSNEIVVELDSLVYARTVIVVSACGAGTAIKGTAGEPCANMKGDDRIIVTSCDRDEPTEATLFRDHVYFLWHDWVEKGFVYKFTHSGAISINDAYESGKDAVWPWHPQLWKASGIYASKTYL